MSSSVQVEAFGLSFRVPVPPSASPSEVVRTAVYDQQRQIALFNGRPLSELSTDELIMSSSRNRGDRLLQQRETVQDKLHGDLAEMENYNALGDIYISRGRFNDARTSYENALKCRDPDAWRGRWKIYANIAALYWESNETQRAAEYYSDALAMATEHDDFEDQVVAREGSVSPGLPTSP